MFKLKKIMISVWLWGQKTHGLIGDKDYIFSKFLSRLAVARRSINSFVKNEKETKKFSQTICIMYMPKNSCSVPLMFCEKTNHSKFYDYYWFLALTIM